MIKTMHVAVGDTVYSIKNAGVPYEVTAVNPDRGTVSVRTKDAAVFEAVDAKIFHKDPVAITRALGSQQLRQLSLIRALIDDSLSPEAARREAREAMDRLNAIDMSTYETPEPREGPKGLIHLSDDDIETVSIRPGDDSVMITHICGSSVVLTRQELIRIVALIENGA
jgi:hypothetical protein